MENSRFNRNLFKSKISFLKNKRYLFISFILFLTSMILNFPFPHDQNSKKSSVLFTITITDTSGINVIGVITAMIFIASLYFMAKSLEKYRVRAVILVILLFVLLPNLIVYSYQKSLATDIYAISYKSESSECEFRKKENEQLKAVCKLSFVNHSKDNVEFTIKFYDNYWFEDNNQTLSLMNQGAPYRAEISGDQQKLVEIETTIDTDNSSDHSHYSNFNVIIESDKGIREL